MSRLSTLRSPAATRLAIGASLVMALALTAAPAHATIMRALSFADLMTRASDVAMVTCTGQRALRDGRRRIVTDYTLVVEESLKGTRAAGTQLTMRSLGGVIGDLGMRIEGEPRLEPGARYLVFLEHRGGSLRPVGMSQGVLPVDEDPTGALQVHPGGAGLSLVRSVGGAMSPAGGALEAVQPWTTLRARLESQVSGATRP